MQSLLMKGLRRLVSSSNDLNTSNNSNSNTKTNHNNNNNNNNNSNSVNSASSGGSETTTTAVARVAKAIMEKNEKKKVVETDENVLDSFFSGIRDELLLHLQSVEGYTPSCTPECPSKDATAAAGGSRPKNKYDEEEEEEDEGDGAGEDESAHSASHQGSAAAAASGVDVISPPPEKRKGKKKKGGESKSSTSKRSKKEERAKKSESRVSSTSRRKEEMEESAGKSTTATADADADAAPMKPASTASPSDSHANKTSNQSTTSSPAVSNRKPLNDTQLLLVFETLRLLNRFLPAATFVRHVQEHRLMTLFTEYLVQVTSCTRKVRSSCAEVLVNLGGDHPLLLRELLTASLRPLYLLPAFLAEEEEQEDGGGTTERQASGGKGDEEEERRSASSHFKTPNDSPKLTPVSSIKTDNNSDATRGPSTYLTDEEEARMMQANNNNNNNNNNSNSLRYKHNQIILSTNNSVSLPSSSSTLKPEEVKQCPVEPPAEVTAEDFSMLDKDAPPAVAAAIIAAATAATNTDSGNSRGKANSNSNRQSNCSSYSSMLRFRVSVAHLASVVIAALHRFHLAYTTTAATSLVAEMVSMEALTQLLFVAHHIITASRVAEAEEEGQQLHPSMYSVPPSSGGGSPAASSSTFAAGPFPGQPAAETFSAAAAAGTAEHETHSSASSHPPSSLHSSAANLTAARSHVGAGPSGYQVTLAVLYTALLSGCLRGCTSFKRRLVQQHGKQLVELWVWVCAHLGMMETALHVDTNHGGSSGHIVIVLLESLPIWQSEVLEALLEVITEDSFSLRRHALTAESGGGPLTRRYEPLPATWDATLTGGTHYVWHLARKLSTCVLIPGALQVLVACLLRLDTRAALAERIYRGLVTSLMLLCVANPHNAQLLAESTVFDSLIALACYNQVSVFPSSVDVRFRAAEKDEDGIVELSPERALNSNTTQLTVAFLCTLAALHFPDRAVGELMTAVTAFHAGTYGQTDEDVIETLLHVLGTTRAPPQVLFFPGSGGVAWKTNHFVPRHTGCTFATWILPLCVWAEGTPLLCFHDPHTTTSTSVLIIANGRSCFLAVQQEAGRAPVVLPRTNFMAETWTHIVLTLAYTEMKVYINGVEVAEDVLSVAFPKESKKGRMEFTFGTGLQGPNNEGLSFFGSVAAMELLSGRLERREVEALYAAGPQPSAPTLHLVPLISVCAGGGGEAAVGQDKASSGNAARKRLSGLTATPNCVRGSLVERREGISLHGIIPCTAPDTKAVFEQLDVMPWVLRTLKESRAEAPACFAAKARLALRFFVTAMRMCETEAELQHLLRNNFLKSLKEEILQWEDFFPEMPQLLLTAATVWGTSKVLRADFSSQAILDLLLERLACKQNMATTASGKYVSTSCLLRELSDCLLVSENLHLFLSKPQRLQRVLQLSLTMPQPCVEPVVVLLEKMCKGQRELERTFAFLLSPQVVPSADFAKAEIMRMLFDISRSSTAMCETIQQCCKRNGVLLLFMLVNGKNHQSETVRVTALRLLSLLFHGSPALLQEFRKTHGFDLLIKAIVDPEASAVQIRLSTLDTLMQMAFDAYRPTEKMDAAMASKLNSASSPTTKGTATAASTSGGLQRHQDPASPAGLGRGRGQGHLPGIVSRNFKVPRREYSFEVSHDYGRMGTYAEDTYMGKEGLHLRVPEAVHTALGVLGHLVRRIGEASSNGLMTRDSSLSLDQVVDALDDSQRSPASPATANPLGAALTEEETKDEAVVIRTLTYLEKIVDVPANAQALFRHRWILWLWEAVEPLVVTFRGSSSAGAGCGSSTNLAAAGSSHTLPAVSSSNLHHGTGGEGGSPTTRQPSEGPFMERSPSQTAGCRYHRRFASAVMSRTRGIVRKLLICDMMQNPKALSVAYARDPGQSPQLLRLVLDVIGRTFAKTSRGAVAAACDLSDQRDASNFIGNLEVLLAGVEVALVPFPPAVGVEMVSAITTLAVGNNALTRKLMKKVLFPRRHDIALFLLVNTKTLHRVELGLLLQLVDANLGEGTVPHVLLGRLALAVLAKDIDEVETLLLLLQQCAANDEAMRLEVYRLLKDTPDLADLLCILRDDAASASPQSPLDVNHADGNSSELNLTSGSTGYPAAVTPTSRWVTDQQRLACMPTSQLMSWCAQHPTEWEQIAASATKALQRLRERLQEKVRERTAASEVRRDKVIKQREKRVEQESELRKLFAKMKTEVQAMLQPGGGAAGGSSSSSAPAGPSPPPVAVTLAAPAAAAGGPTAPPASS